MKGGRREVGGRGGKRKGKVTVKEWSGQEDKKGRCLDKRG